MRAKLVKESILKGPSQKEIAEKNPKMAEIYDFFKELKELGLTITMKKKPINRLHIDIRELPGYHISLDMDRQKMTEYGWFISKPGDFDKIILRNGSLEDTKTMILNILKKENINISESILKPKSREDIEKQNPEMLELYDVVSKLKGMGYKINVFGLYKLPKYIKAITIEDALSAGYSIRYFGKPYKDKEAGWYIYKFKTLSSENTPPVKVSRNQLLNFIKDIT